MYIFLIYLVLIAALLALLEIQIEGREGWAKNLPTWRLQGTWLNRLLGRQELTGYHWHLNLFVLGLFHLPFVMGSPWSWILEMRVLGGMTVMFVIEDFLWFVFNPRWRLREFFAHQVPWHKLWLGPFPAFYYSGLIVGGWLIYWSYR